MSHSRTSSAEFASTSILEALVPIEGAIDCIKAVQKWDGKITDSRTSQFPFITPRRFLYFDEQAPVIFALRTGPVADGILQTYLNRLSLKLEVTVVDLAQDVQSNDGSKEALAKELLHSGSVAGAQDPLIYRGRGSETYIFWKITIALPWPKQRFQKPALYMVASAGLRSSQQKIQLVDKKNPYMTPFQTAPINILEPLNHDPLLPATNYVFPETLLIGKPSYNAPPPQEFVRNLRSGYKRLYPIAPAVTFGVRYSKLRHANLKTPIIVSAHVDITPFASTDVEILSIAPSVSDGDVNPLGDSEVTKLPQTRKPGDELAWVYSLTSPELTALAPTLPQQVLSFTVRATLLLSPVCRPYLILSWSGTISAAGLTPLPRPNLAAGGGVGGGAAAGAGGAGGEPRATTGSRPQSLLSPPPIPQQQQQHQSAATPPDPNLAHGPGDFGIGLSFSPAPGPTADTSAGAVHIGSVVAWNCLIVNRSPHLRRLAVIPIPRRRRPDAGHPSHRTSGVRTSVGPKGKTAPKVIPLPTAEELPEAVTDEKVLHFLQRRAATEPEDLVCLTPDMRVGPLPPGACYETRLEFLVLNTGALRVDCVRIVDVDRGDGVDVVEVPDILSVPKSQE